MSVSTPWDFLPSKPKILEPLVRDFEGRRNWPRAKG